MFENHLEQVQLPQIDSSTVKVIDLRNMPEELVQQFKKNGNNLDLAVHPYYMDFPYSPDASLEFRQFQEARNSVIRQGLRGERNLVVTEQLRSLTNLVGVCERLGGGTLVCIPTRLDRPTPYLYKGQGLDDLKLDNQAWKVVTQNLGMLVNGGQVNLLGTRLDHDIWNSEDLLPYLDYSRPKALAIVRDNMIETMGGCVGYTFRSLVKASGSFDIDITALTYPHRVTDWRIAEDRLHQFITSLGAIATFDSEFI